jgi:flavin-dependent dehydrogenase
VSSFDAVIVGAGPAGAAVAINLAPDHRVLLVERDLAQSARIGESLPPCARRLLSDMGLYESFEAEGHIRCYANRAVWGSARPLDLDFLHSLDGYGWHLDRPRFDGWLRSAAIQRGAELVAPARLKHIAKTDRGWRIWLTTQHRVLTTDTRFLIDAGGRVAPVARRLGARRRASDHLVAGWIRGQVRDPGYGAGLSFVEACCDGWWYTAPLPNAARVLAFHTDADLAAASIARDPAALLSYVQRHAELAEVLSNCGFTAGDVSGYTAAHSSMLKPCVGRGWLAVGDAAAAFDPLSAQGLMNALFTGLAAAQATHCYLNGDNGALSAYAEIVDHVTRSYRNSLALWYGLENRWAHNLFWKRRANLGAAEDLPAIHSTKPSAIVAGQDHQKPDSFNPGWLQ